MRSDLERACDDVLRKNLPAEITSRIRRLLEAGHPPRTILALYRKAGATRKTLTGIAVETEIDAISAEIKARSN